MSKIIFKMETDLNRYSAKNGKIDEVGINILEDRYENKGYSFYNDGDEAVMEWPDNSDGAVLFSASRDFENFIVPIRT